MNTVITLTGFRHLSFNFCERWMAQQTTQDFEWIVCSDDNTRCTRGQTSLYVELKSLPKKLAYVLQHIKDRSGYVYIVEDDDYYGPKYLETYFKLAQHGYDIIGEDHARYYNLSLRKQWRTGNKHHASLAQTAFKASLIPEVISICRASNACFVDIRIWRALKRNSYLIHDTMDKLKLHCSIKAMPGRSGFGAGHGEHKDYSDDQDFKVFKNWVPDYEPYLELAQW